MKTRVLAIGLALTSLWTAPGEAKPNIVVMETSSTIWSPTPTKSRADRTIPSTARWSIS